MDFELSDFSRQAREAGAAVLDNPYTYTEYKSEDTHGARGSLF